MNRSMTSLALLVSGVLLSSAGGQEVATESQHSDGADSKRQQAMLDAITGLRDEVRNLRADVKQLRQGQLHLDQREQRQEQDQWALQMQVLKDEMANLRSEMARLSQANSQAEMEVLKFETLLEVERNPSKQQAIIDKQIAEDARLTKLKEEATEVELEIAQRAAATNDQNDKELLGFRRVLEKLRERINKRGAELEQQLADRQFDSKEAELTAMLDVAKRAAAKHAEQLAIVANEYEQRKKALAELASTLQAERPKPPADLGKRDAGDEPTLFGVLKVGQRVVASPHEARGGYSIQFYSDPTIKTSGDEEITRIERGYIVLTGDSAERTIPLHAIREIVRVLDKR